MKKVIDNKKGFTLVELIVVITIIAILATIGFLAYANYIKGARDTDRISAVKELSVAVETYDSTGNKPTRLGLIREMKKFPTDPTNNLSYQYNVNSAGKSITNKNLGGKGYIICTNRPLEKYSDDDWNVLPDYLNAIDPIKDRKIFIDGKLQDKNGDKYDDVGINSVMAYYCAGVTTDFKSLVAGWGSNSIGTQSCSTDLLDPRKEAKTLGQACKVVFNTAYDNQAPGTSPSAGTPFPMPTE